MKKVLSVFLALIMTLSFSSVAFAAKSCKCNNVPVVFIRGFGASIYEYDENGEAHSIFPPDNTTMMKAVPSLALAVGCWAAKNYEGFGKFTTAAMNICVMILKIQTNLTNTNTLIISAIK